MNNDLQFHPSDLEEVSYELNSVIIELEEDLEEFLELDFEMNAGGKAVEAEQYHHSTTIKRYETQIELLENIKEVLDDLQQEIDEKVHLGQEEFIFTNGEEINSKLKDLFDYIFKNKTYNSIVKENNGFDMWEESVKLNPLKKEEEKEAYKHNRKILDEVNDELHSRFKKIENLIEKINIEYDACFSDLKGAELVDEIISGVDLDMKLSSSDFLPPTPPTPNPNHDTLDLAGEIPVFPIGMIADAINLIEYLIEGDLTNVLWSAFAFVPAIGELAYPLKHGDNISDSVKKIDDIGEGEQKADDVPKKKPIQGIRIDTVKFDDLPQNVHDGYDRNHPPTKKEPNGSTEFIGTSKKNSGKTYDNEENILPATDSSGKPISYKEYDVNEKVDGKSRDKERFIVGSDGSEYYSNTHCGDDGEPAFMKIEK